MMDDHSDQQAERNVESSSSMINNDEEDLLGLGGSSGLLSETAKLLEDEVHEPLHKTDGGDGQENALDLAAIEIEDDKSAQSEGEPTVDNDGEEGGLVGDKPSDLERQTSVDALLNSPILEQARQMTMEFEEQGHFHVDGNFSLANHDEDEDSTTTKKKVSMEEQQEEEEQVVDEGIMEDALGKIVACTVQDVSLVCCGASLNLKDIFLLDSLHRVPLRQDVDNASVLMAWKEVLIKHDYEVRYIEDGQIRASFGAPDESTTNDSKPTMEEKTTRVQPLQQAFAFSFGKLQQAVDALPIQVKPAVMTSTISSLNDNNNQENQSYVHIAVGVDIHNKERVALISGLETKRDDIFRGVIQQGITRCCSSKFMETPRAGSGTSLSNDYITDLNEAFRIAGERELIYFMQPMEKATRNREWNCAQMITLLKVCYKEYGVRMPTLEKPPFVSQMPLEYDDDDGVDAQEDADEEEFKGFSEIERLDRKLKISFLRKWNRELHARKKRKEKQLKIRADLCGNNSKTVIARLRDSDVARTSKETIVLSKEFEIQPNVVLGHVSCIHERRPGTLSITFAHILFTSNVFGFKAKVMCELDEFAQITKVNLKGTASLVGDAALVAVRPDNSKVQFIIPSIIDCNRVLELITQITEMRIHSKQKTQQIEEQNKLIITENNQVDATADPSRDTDRPSNQQDEQKRMLDMKKMMESTMLQDDEEEF